MAPSLIFIHKGNQESTNYDTLMPKSSNDEFAYWSDEIGLVGF
jgi:hypothetical protein